MSRRIVLGFDYGLRHIGTAVLTSDPAIASPLGVISARNGIPNWEKLARLVVKWQPQRMVVGLPLHMDGGGNPLVVRARRFAKELEQRCQCPCELFDERLSSYEATSRLQDTKGSDHSVAAQIILESWHAAQPKPTVGPESPAS